MFEGSDVISLLKNPIEYSFVFFESLIKQGSGTGTETVFYQYFEDSFVWTNYMGSL